MQRAVLSLGAVSPHQGATSPHMQVSSPGHSLPRVLSHGQLHSPGRGMPQVLSQPDLQSPELRVLHSSRDDALSLLQFVESTVTKVSDILDATRLLVSDTFSSVSSGIDDAANDENVEEPHTDSWMLGITAKMFNCSALSGDELYRFVLWHLSGDTGRMPSPAQIMWVAPEVHAHDVRAYVQRAAAYPALRFAIVMADKLTAPCREELTRCLLCRAGRRAQLCLFFSAANGQSSLSFLDQRVDVTSAETPLHADLRRLNSALLPAPHELRIFSDVAVFFGESGSGKTEAIRTELNNRVGSDKRWLRIPIHGDFDISALIAMYTSLVEAAVPAMKPSRTVDDRPEVGLFFDVSAPAVEGGRQDASIFLHALLTQGLLIDAFSGAIAALDVRVRHVVCVELPALPTWPLRASAHFADAAHPFIRNGLSVLGITCTVERPVNNATVPFTIDAAAEYVTPVLKAVLEGTPVDAVLSQSKKPVKGTPSAGSISAPGAGAFDDPSPRDTTLPPSTARNSILCVLEALWALPECKGVPTTKHARNMLVRLLQTRIQYLYDVYAHVCALLKDESYSFLSHAVATTPQFFDRLARIFVLESINLCDTNLRRNWANPAQQYVWSVRDRDMLSFTLLCLAQGVRHDDISDRSTGAPARGGLLHNRATTADAELRGLGKITTLRETLEQQPTEDGGSVARLRTYLAPGFGIGDTARMNRILTAAGYVLRYVVWIRVILYPATLSCSYTL